MPSGYQRRRELPKECCGNCLYMRTGYDDWFECHRSAPQLSIRRECDDPEIKTISKWPNVSTTNWCGDYVEKGKSRGH